MELIDLINQYALADAEAGKWQAVADTLNAPSITLRDPTAVTYASLARDFGDDARALVAGTIRAGAKAGTALAGELADAHAVLLMENVGMRIDSDARQDIIKQLAVAGSWPDALRDGILRSRVRQVSPAAQAGLPVLTPELCEGSWREAKRAELLQSMRSRFDRIQNLFGTAEKAEAAAELRAMATDAEA